MEEQENTLQSRSVASAADRTPQPPAFEPAGGQDASPEAERKRPKWLVPVAAGCALALVAAGGVAWHAWDTRRRVEAAKASCADSVALVKKRQGAWERLLAADDTVAALAVTDEQVEDAATVTALADAAVASSGKVAACDATDAAGLDAAAATNGKVADAYAKASGTLTDAVAAVTASRDAKLLADARSGLEAKLGEARTLLSDSDGRVADTATRDALSKAIDEAGKGADDAAKLGELKTALESAMRQVDDSVAAKTKADEEAAAQAAAAAAAAQAQQSWTPSYSYSGGSGSTWSGGSAGGASAGGAGGGASSSGGSAGGWSGGGISFGGGSNGDHTYDGFSNAGKPVCKDGEFCPIG